ncbi:MAG TPA: CotH kinase family protein, partial [Myxococcota bacterium]|nr:CotH kinase family protein [Myxococcota bacterium]
MRSRVWIGVMVLWVACGGEEGRQRELDGVEVGREVEDTSEADSEVDPDADNDADNDVVDVEDGLSPWPVAGGAAFEALFRTDVVQRVTLRVTEAEWDALIAHMLEYAAIDGNMRTNRYFRADFVHEGQAGDTTIEEVGFRTRGNTTREVPEADGVFQRAHFKVKFDALFDLTPGTPEYDIRDERRFAGLKELSFKWGREKDPSQIRELFAYELFRAVGVPVPRVVPVDLTFQIGERIVHYGLYLGIENVDKPFLGKRFGSDNDGDLYKCLWLNEGPATLTPITNRQAVGVKDWTRNYRPAYDLQTNEETSSHADLYALIDNLDTLDDAALTDWLETRFDVEHFLRALAVNVLVGMPDDYWAMGNNYYLYFGAGKTRFIPWDYDHGLGGGWGGEPAWDHEQIADSDPFVWKNLNRALGVNVDHPLVERLLRIPTYRARYAVLLDAILDSGHFSPEAWRALFDRQAPLYAPYLANDTGPRDEGGPGIDALMEPAGEEAWIARRI